MKKELTKTTFAIHYIDAPNSLLEQVWTNHNSIMTVDDYKVDMLNYLEFVELYQTKKALINAQQIGFAITPDIQEWVDTVISVRTNKIVQKIAFVLSSDIFEQISIQQTMSENEGKKVESRFFDNINEAINWLLND